MTRLVGLDVGTTSAKAVAVSPSGELLGTAEREYALHVPRPGFAEQDPEDWWRGAEAALAELGPADALGLSGQMHGLVLLDAHGRVLRPAILWNDGRTAAECAEIERLLGRQRLVELTGNRALAGFTAPKLLWVRRHEPEVWSRVRHVLLPKDYVRLRLTGELATDVADASGTLLFDVGRRRWSEEAASALEVPLEWLPPVLESAEQAGRTPAGTPVAAGAGDQAAAAIGVGIDRPGPASVVLGTSGVVFAALPGYRHDPQARLHVFCHAVPGAWHAMGVTLSAAGSLRWLRDVAAPGASFAELAAEAERWPPGCEGLLFLPYLSGERTPHDDPSARGAFLGLSLAHDRGALVRAVMEGVAYSLRDALELFDVLDARPRMGRVSGGGARSALWLAILAAILGIPLERAGSEEGSAFGAALLGGVAGGVFADVAAAIAACVRAEQAAGVSPAWSEAYAGGYDRFRAAYPLAASP